VGESAVNDARLTAAADGRQVVFAGYYLAHWWPRVWATLLDGLILAPVNFALALSFHLFTVTHQLDANGTSVPRLETHDLAAETHVVQTKQQPAHTPNTFEAALASARSAQEPAPMADAGSTLLREVPIGANVYVALRDIAPDTVGACWIDPAAPVRTDSDNVHVVRVSHAPEGLFVSVPTAYESLLASNPSEAAQHERAGWRRATLSFS